MTLKLNSISAVVEAYVNFIKLSVAVYEFS